MDNLELTSSSPRKEKIQEKKRHSVKKMEKDEAERRERQALFESDSLYHIEQSEKKRSKTLKATSTLGTPKDTCVKDSDEKLSKKEQLELKQQNQDQLSGEDEDFEKFEFRSRRCVFELDKLIEIEKQKKMELQKKKEAVYKEMEITLAESRRARNRNQSHGGTKWTLPPLMPLRFLQCSATSDAKPAPLLQRRHDLAKRPPSSPEPPIPNRIVLDKKNNAKTKTPLKLPPINSPPRKCI